jgi:hypothetical protein
MEKIKTFNSFSHNKSIPFELKNKTLNKKFSVIIPTLWKSHRTTKLLSDLSSFDGVGEIILIDNSNTEHDIISNDKIKVYKQKENIFVNPAWNLGVKLSTCDYIALCNDDINFSFNIFEYLLPIIDNYGVIGQSAKAYTLKNNDKPDIKKCKKRPHGWGCLIFLPKIKWINIPEELKINCGDEFLFKNVNGGAFTIENFNISTEMSTTTSSSQDLIDIQYRDIDLYDKLYK